MTIFIYRIIWRKKYNMESWGEVKASFLPQYQLLIQLLSLEKEVRVVAHLER